MVQQHLTEEQIAEFKEAFSLFDEDGNGTITTKQLGAVMRSIGINPTEAEISSLINEIKTNDVSKIEFQDFLTMMERKMNMVDPEDEFFTYLGGDNDGFISIPELTPILKNLGEALTDEEINEMIRAADVDHNGQINVHDFVRLMESK